MARDCAVQRLEHWLGSPAENTTGTTCGAHGHEQLWNARAISGQRAVGPREPPRLQPLPFGQPGKKRRCGLALERQDRKLVEAIEPGGNTGREAAELALAVVEENGTAQLFYPGAPAANPRRVARTSGPIVSST